MDRLKQLSLKIEPVNGNLFSHVQMAPPDPILGTALAFQKDPSQDKINLGIGAYRDGDGKPYVFKAVEEAEEIIRKNKHNKEYLPIDGSAPFCEGARRLLLGDCPAVK
jgi:aspartate/tyrosine/aromatic aminotransferase